MPVRASGGLGRNYSYKRCLGGFNKNGYNLFPSHPLQLIRVQVFEGPSSNYFTKNHLSWSYYSIALQIIWKRTLFLSKQLVTVGLLVPAHCQLSNACICNRCAMHLNSQDYIIQYILSYTVYGSIFLNDLRFDAFSLYSCRYSLMRCIFKACSISHYFLHVYVIVYWWL